MRQLVYVSRAVRTMEMADLQHILDGARHRNAEHNVTGVLFVKDKMFFQYLEGADRDVETIFQIIRRDRRHADLLVLVDESAERRRIFADWKMGFQHLSAVQSSIDPNAIVGENHGFESSLVLATGSSVAADLVRAFWYTNRRAVAPA